MLESAAALRPLSSSLPAAASDQSETAPLSGEEPSAAERSAGTLRLTDLALAALARCVPPGAEAPPMQVLLRARALLVPSWADGLPGLVARCAALPAAGDRVLCALAAVAELDAANVLALALCAAVEDDPAVGRALAALQAGAPRPSFGLLDRAFHDAVAGDASASAARFRLRPSSLLVQGPAERAGLLLREHQDLPLSEQTLRLPLAALLALRSSSVPPAGAWLAPVPVPKLWRDVAARLAAGLRLGATRSRERCLVIRGGDRREREAAAATMAAALGRRALLATPTAWQMPGLSAWCFAAQALPVLHAGSAAGAGSAAENTRETSPLGACTPWLILAGGAPGEQVSEAAAVWTLSVPSLAERTALWTSALANEGPNANGTDASAASAEASELAVVVASAARLRCGPARIAALAAAAHAEARLADRTQPRLSDLAAAIAACDPGLGALAAPIRDAVETDALVLPTATQRELDALLLRCQHREGLEEGLGASFAARAPCGVRALLVGPPGTGKSLAAAWLARRLGLPLYRVDLAAVASKYIGETEQNLGALLDAAAAADVVLLFDEADALFANRTEVRDAADRHANAVVNYLLSRLETHAGIVLLTANSRVRFDAAFARRLDAVIDVPLPGPEERRALWRCHLGKAHGLSAVELNRLAAGADLAGGHIRTAVLAAALHARSQQRRIVFADLVAALAGEYRKLGRALPSDLRGGPA